MLAVIGFLFVVVFFVLIIMFIATRKKNQNRAFKMFLSAWGCFILGIILVFANPNEPEKQQAAQTVAKTETTAAETSDDQSEVTNPKTETTTKVTGEIKKDTDEAKWQESYKDILLGEAQSYIELSVRGTLTKDRFESAVGVLEKYATRVAPDQQEKFKELADTVKANNLNGAKELFEELGGENFPELNKNAKAVSFN